MTSNECIAIKTSQGWARSSEPCPRCGSGPCHRTSNQVEFSMCREPDGDVSFELYADRHNLVSISVSSSGTINWAGMVNGTSACGPGAAYTALGMLLYTLLNSRVPSDD